MVHGDIYPPDRIESALTHYFRVGNLTALREIALLWLADRVEEGLQRYRAEHGIVAPWETRERIRVSLSGGPEGETLIRRAARISARTPGTELLHLPEQLPDVIADAALLTRALTALGADALRHSPPDRPPRHARPGPRTEHCGLPGSGYPGRQPGSAAFARLGRGDGRDPGDDH